MKHKLTLEQRKHQAAEKQYERTLRKLKALSPGAITVLELSMSEPMRKAYPGIALAAAKDVLDRNGYSGKQIVELSGANGGPVQTEVVVRFVKGKP